MKVRIKRRGKKLAILAGEISFLQLKVVLGVGINMDYSQLEIVSLI